MFINIKIFVRDISAVEVHVLEREIKQNINADCGGALVTCSWEEIEPLSGGFNFTCVISGRVIDWMYLSDILELVGDLDTEITT